MNKDKTSEKQYSNFFNNALNGFALHEIVTDDQGEPVDYVFLDVNPAFEKLTGLKATDIIGKRVTEVLPGIEKDPFIQIYGKVALTGEPTRFEQYATPLDKYYDIAVFSPRKGHFAVSFTDITELKKKEKELEEVNQTLRTLSSRNQTLIRSREESQLLNDLCRNIVNVGGYHLVWVGFLENGEDKSIKPLAQAGFNEGELAKIAITNGVSSKGIGATINEAIKDGEPKIVQDICSNPEYKKLHVDASKHDYQSLIVLPLTFENKTLGVLNIYAQKVDAFKSREEVGLLEELADDMAYGIQALRTREAQKRVDKLLQEMITELESIFASSPSAIVVTDLNGNVMKCNQRTVEMHGYLHLRRR